MKQYLVYPIGLEEHVNLARSLVVAKDEEDALNEYRRKNFVQVDTEYRVIDLIEQSIFRIEREVNETVRRIR